MFGTIRRTFVRRAALVPSLLVLLLLATSPAAYAAPSGRSPSPLPYYTLVPHGYFVYFPLTTVSTDSKISIVVSSDNPISTALMSSSQFQAFNDSLTDLAQSLYLRNATTAQANIRVSTGTFYLVFYAYSRHANVSYNFESYPTDPYPFLPFQPPEPTGIASFGLYNQSGNSVPYSVETNEVVGVSNITSLQAYNATAGLAQSNISGATLQLNTVLLVNETDGLQQSYWIQNTPDFVTSTSQLAFSDNLWNFSVSGYVDNSTVTSSDGGLAFSYPDGSTTGYYYSYEGSNFTYSLPMELVLAVNESVQQGTGVSVGFGAQLAENGKPVGPLDWFDRVLIHDQTAQSAYYFVSGNLTAPDGLYYDTELVYCGEANGEATDFTQMNSTLGLYYLNPSTGGFTSFPSLYAFGGDTAESADDLQVTYSGNGIAEVAVGNPDYVYLGLSSGTLSLPSLVGNFTTTSASSASQTVTTTASSSSVSTSTGSSATTSSQSGGPSLSLALTPSFFLTFLPVAFAIVLMLRGGIRARRN